MIQIYYNDTLDSFNASIINLSTNVTLDDTFNYTWKLNNVVAGVTTTLDLNELNVGDKITLSIDKNGIYTGEYDIYSHFGTELTQYYSLSSDNDINHL